MNSIRWHYTDRDYFISENPIDVELRLLQDQLYDLGLVSIKSTSTFKYFSMDIGSAPIDMRVRYYSLNLDWIAFELSLGHIHEAKDIARNCKMLAQCLVELLTQRHCL